MNILIACYSYTGNTYRIADAIRALTGGTLCVICPRQPYPMQFQKLLHQVRKENETGYLPSLLPGLEKTEGYDIVFAGTPNWCGTIAPPLAAYLAANDLAGKTIVPFYSHCGGWKGNIEAAIQRLCPDAIVHSDFSLINDGGDQLIQRVSQWLRELGIEITGSIAHEPVQVSGGIQSWQ